MQHHNAKAKGDFWTVHNIKPFKDKYMLYHSKWKQRRETKWKNPEVPDTPTTVLKEVVAIHEGSP